MTNAPSRSGGQHHLRVEWAGTTRTFEGDRVVVGREADCEVQVHEPSASRHHAVLQREGDSWVVVDTSSNGTFVVAAPAGASVRIEAAGARDRFGNSARQAFDR